VAAIRHLRREIPAALTVTLALLASAQGHVGWFVRFASGRVAPGGRVCDGVRCWGVAGGWAQLSVGQQRPAQARLRLLGPARLGHHPTASPAGCVSGRVRILRYEPYPAQAGMTAWRGMKRMRPAAWTYGSTGAWETMPEPGTDDLFKLRL
jgi:hypothetical protein